MNVVKHVVCEDCGEVVQTGREERVCNRARLVRFCKCKAARWSALPYEVDGWEYHEMVPRDIEKVM